MRPARRTSLSCASSLAVALALGAYGPEVAAQTPVTSTPSAVAAQARFDHGRELYLAGNSGDALSEFRASLELFRSPNTRLYVGLCLQRLGRFAEAYEELSRTVVEAGDMIATDRRYEGARDLARQSVAEIEPHVALLTLRAESLPPGLEVHVGDVALDVGALGVARAFEPGELEVVARAPGFAPFRETVRPAAGARASVAIVLRPPTEPPPPPPAAVVPPVEGPVVAAPLAPTVAARVGGGVRVAGFAVGGVGVGSLVAFAVLGSMASSQYSSLSQVCPRPACTADRVQEINRGVTLTAGANAMLGVGLVAVVAGAVMIGVGGPRAVAPAAEAFVDPARGIVGVRGAF